ncbi:MAG: response regulator [Thermoflexales bacterium]|nr:response regulator [Thermoflexales bacterium]
MDEKHILIIDDERLVRRAMADYLAECGYQTAAAPDGMEGLALIRAKAFDAVLVDLRMPGMDGLDLIAAMSIEQPELPLVVVSGAGLLGDAVEAMRRGAWDYVTKPIHDMDELVMTIDRVLDKARLKAERNRYQHELEQLNLSLEVEVARQTHDLQQANAELRHLDTLREQFIQNVAHELRTPLALVRGYIEVLVEDELSIEEQKKALGVAHQQVMVLVELVEAITTLQDINSQALQISQVAVSELLHTACQMASQRAASSGIKLRSVCPADFSPLPGDFTRLAQALYQLLDNACKFSPTGSTVTITAHMSPLNNVVNISVADQGIGIPPEEHAHIFERFYQIDGSTTRRYGGTGLGLALVKEIATAHGGQVSIQSAVDAGSTFTISLPISLTNGKNMV